RRLQDELRWAGEGHRGPRGVWAGEGSYALAHLNANGGTGMRLLGRAGMLGVVAVALAGCWPAPGGGPDRQGFNPFETAISPANVAQLEPAWSAPTDLGAVEDPVVAGG